MRRILILGGTTEARQLADAARRVAPTLDVTLSLAGRTRRRRRAAGAGADRRLRRRRRALPTISQPSAIDVLIDATHPYAAQISRHARRGGANAACRSWRCAARLGTRADGDRWTEVGRSPRRPCKRSASTPRRVFLALGRQELGAVRAAPQHSYLVRSVDPVDPPLAVPRRDLCHRPRAVHRSRRPRDCCARTRSRSSSPRTAAATPPTARSRRRARSASR